MARHLDFLGEIALVLDVDNGAGTTDTWNIDVYGRTDFPKSGDTDTDVAGFRIQRFIIDGIQNEQLIFTNIGFTHLWLQISKNGSTDTLELTNAYFVRLAEPLGARG